MKPTFLRRNMLFIAGTIMMALSLVFSTFSVVRVLSAPLSAPATIPSVVGFEGFLADSSGNPIPDGTYSITFTVWDDAAGGNDLWHETQSQVQVTKGLYAVQLGSVESLPPNLFSGNRWIGVQKGQDSEITPRTAVSSVPFALNALGADLVDGLHAYTSGANEHLVASDSSGGVTVSGGLNVGTATGAAAGQIRGEKEIYSFGYRLAGPYLIDSKIVGAGGQQTIVFDNIPQTFTDLKFVWKLRCDKAGATSTTDKITVNAVSTGYYNQSLQSFGATVLGTDALNAAQWTIITPGANSPANSFGMGELTMYDYADSSKLTMAYYEYGQVLSFASAGMRNIHAHLYMSTAQAITKVTFTAEPANKWVQGSKIYMYGVY